MPFIKNPYVGKSLKKREDLVRGKIENGKIVLSVFLIAYPEGENNQLEIFDALYLQNAFIKARQPVIIGMAGSRYEAMEMVSTLAKRAFEVTGSYDIRKYLLRKEAHRGCNPDHS